MDESLEMKNDIRCDLFSSVSPSEVTLTLFDKKQNKFLALEVFKQANGSDGKWMKEISDKSVILKKNNFKTVNVEIVNELTTLVPVALFEEEDAGKYFQYNFSGDDLLIKSEKIPAFDAVNIYAVHESMNVSIHQLFDQPVIHHHATVLLQGIHLSFKKFNEKTLVINVRNHYVDIIITEGKQLIFFNSFQSNTVDDLVYYVMFVCDRLQLNPESVSAFLTGQVESESAIFHMLYKYIKNISFVSRTDFFEFSYVFEEIPSHFYFNLFCLALCES